jgi:hypothetical protein
MQMVKQQPGSGQCGLCAVAMLTDRTREEMLVDFPNCETTADYDWLNYMRHALGFTLEDPRDDDGFDRTLTCDGRVFSGHFKLPMGFRYYCTIVVVKSGVEVPHAVAIDENGMVFDPSNSAPPTATCTLEQYVRHNHKIFGAARIGCCYRVIAK